MTDDLQMTLLSKNFLEAESVCNVGYATVYHYTSPDGLLGILQPGGAAKLWFTRYDSLNDINERKDIVEFLHGYCKYQVKVGKISQEFSDAITALELSDDELLTYPGKYPIVSESFGEIESWTGAKNVLCDTYLCCFSENPDLLPMWNYYTKSQHYEGYSIGFDSYRLGHNRGFEKGYSLELKRVIYTDSEKASLLDKILLPLEEYFTNGTDTDKTDILATIREKLSEFQFVFKNLCFQHEQEIRAILQIPRDETLPDCPQFVVKYRNSNGYIVPYIEYNVPSEAVHEITVAPLLQADISVNNISEMLTQRGYKNVSIKTSKVPIRF